MTPYHVYVMVCMHFRKTNFIAVIQKFTIKIELLDSLVAHNITQELEIIMYVYM